MIIKSLKAILKDEKRAYEAAAYSTNYWLSLCGKDMSALSNISDLKATLYRETLQVLKQELSHTTLNRLKKIF